MANTMITDMDRAMRSGRRSPVADAAAEQSALEAGTSKPQPEESIVPKCSISELLQSQAKYTNETSGFKAFADIWSIEKVDQLNVRVDDNVLMESNSLLSKFKSLQGLRRSTTATTGQLGTIKEKESSRTSSRYNSETDSLQSGTSMMAMHDANEFEEGQSEPVTGVSKVIPPQPAPTSDFTMETEVLQLRGKLLTRNEATARAKPTALATEERTETAKKPAKRKKQPSDENYRRLKTNLSASPEPSSSETSVSDVNARLIEECLTRQVEVRLDMLSSQDIEKLRGLRVRVKRTNFRHYYRELKMQQEHSRSSSRSKRSHNHTDDSNASTSTSELQSEGRRRSKGSKQFVHITSDSAEPSVHLKRFKHITSDSSTSTDPEEAACSASRERRRRGHKWSQQKIKVNQPKSPKVRHVTGDTDVIELSSDSSSSSRSPVPVPVTVSRFPAMVLPLELDPLYEEEIVPFWRCLPDALLWFLSLSLSLSHTRLARGYVTETNAVGVARHTHTHTHTKQGQRLGTQAAC